VYKHQLPLLREIFHSSNYYPESMHCCTAITNGFYPPKSGIKISCATSLSFWVEVPQIGEKERCRFLEKGGNKNGGVLIHNLFKNPPVFTGCKLHPPGIGIEATGYHIF